MASLEWRVISELLRSKDMIAVNQLGFNDEHLSGEPEAAQIFDYVRAWYHHPNTARQFPTKESIKRRWPAFQMTGAKTDSGTLRTLLQECKGLSLEADVRALADYFFELVEEDPQKAVEIMQSQLSRISYENQPSSGFSLEEIADDMQAHYEGALTGSIYGIPWPWECLTTDTLGKNPEDFIVLYGRMKSMKTWIMLVNAMEDYLVHKKRVLIWSREMNRKKMSLRSGAILGRVDYQCLKDGSLPAPLYDQAIKAVRAMAAMYDRGAEALAAIRKNTYEVKDLPDLMVLSGRGAPMTLEGIDSVVQAFCPDIVYLDSMYHLNCEASTRARSEPERQRALSVQTKQCAINWNIPVFATVQANREGEKTHGETMADVGWTDSLAQEGDVIIRVLYRHGPAPFEDEYEGYWKQLEEDMADARNRKKRQGAGRMRIRMSPQAKEKFGRSKVPPKIQAKFDRLPKKDRKSAELFLMMGGNREGTLDGLSIRCIPVYDWEVTRENITTDEVKELFKKEKGGGGKSKKSGKNRSVDPARAGNSFSGLK